MKATQPLSKLVLANVVASVSIGIALFYFAGGMHELARDVGDSGAWLVQLVFQGLNAGVSCAGLVVVVVTFRRSFRFAPTMLSSTLAASSLSAAVTSYGLYRQGPAIDAAVFFVGTFCIAIAAHALLAAVVGRPN